MLSFSTLKQSAKNNLAGRWKTAILCFFLMNLVYAIVMIITLLLQLFSRNTSIIFSLIFGVVDVLYVLSYMYSQYFIALSISNRYEIRPSDSFIGLKHFNRSAPLTLLYMVKIFLWSLLFYIPGIIKMFSYSMCFFIKIENPNMPSSEAIRRSQAIMEGHKTDLFFLLFSFIGWYLLIGIGFAAIMVIIAFLVTDVVAIIISTISIFLLFLIVNMFLYPYILTTTAEFYNYVKAEYEMRMHYENGSKGYRL